MGYKQLDQGALGDFERDHVKYEICSTGNSMTPTALFLYENMSQPTTWMYFGPDGRIVKIFSAKHNTIKQIQGLYAAALQTALDNKYKAPEPDGIDVGADLKSKIAGFFEIGDE